MVSETCRRESDDGECPSTITRRSHTADTAESAQHTPLPRIHVAPVTMTRLLYLEEPYTFTHESRIVQTTSPTPTPSSSSTPPTVHVVLDETIAFAEGGGQPGDTGVVTFASGARGELVDVQMGDDSVVTHVIEVEGATPEDVAADAVVTISIDQEKRKDNMQQHTSQHLLSAVAHELAGAATTSWWLSNDETTIDLDPSKDGALDGTFFARLEDTVNALIRDATPVHSHVLDADGVQDLIASRADDGAKFRSRGLPPGVTENIRIVEIPGWDINTCCGTHVTNLAELQVIKLMPAGKRKGKTVLRFLSGSRVANRLASAVLNEKALNNVLGTGEWVDAISHLQTTLKSTRKAQASILGKLGKVMAEQAVAQAQAESAPCVFVHLDEGDKVFVKEVQTVVSAAHPSLPVFVSVGYLDGPNADGSGMIALSVADGQWKDAIPDLGAQAIAVLGGRGGGKKGKFQAKVVGLSSSALDQARSLIVDALQQ